MRRLLPSVNQTLPSLSTVIPEIEGRVTLAGPPSPLSLGFQVPARTSIPPYCPLTRRIS